MSLQNVLQQLARTNSPEIAVRVVDYIGGVINNLSGVPEMYWPAIADYDRSTGTTLEWFFRSMVVGGEVVAPNNLDELLAPGRITKPVFTGATHYTCENEVRRAVYLRKYLRKLDRLQYRQHLLIGLIVTLKQQIEHLESLHDRLAQLEVNQGYSFSIQGMLSFVFENVTDPGPRQAMVDDILRTHALLEQPAPGLRYVPHGSALSTGAPIKEIVNDGVEQKVTLYVSLAEITYLQMKVGNYREIHTFQGLVTLALDVLVTRETEKLSTNDFHYGIGREIFGRIESGIILSKERYRELTRTEEVPGFVRRVLTITGEADACLRIVAKREGVDVAHVLLDALWYLLALMKFSRDNSYDLSICQRGIHPILLRYLDLFE